jgi:RNA polymerase sigma-70 factor (ECF subfamily)
MSRSSSLPAEPPADGTEPHVVMPDLAALRRGDESAFHALFDRLYGPLRGYARALAGDDATGDDLVQEAFVRLWDRRAALSDDTPLAGYLYRTVRNLAFNHRRDVATRRRLLDDPAATESAAAPGALPAPDAALQSADVSARLLAFVADLPPRQREAIELSRMQGLSHQDVAAAMGCAPRTVNNHLVAALSTLRRRLSEAGALVAALVWLVP